VGRHGQQRRQRWAASGALLRMNDQAVEFRIFMNLLVATTHGPDRVDVTPAIAQ
jgi:hypothetical protein